MTTPAARAYASRLMLDYAAMRALRGHGVAGAWLEARIAELWASRAALREALERPTDRPETEDEPHI